MTSAGCGLLQLAVVRHPLHGLYAARDFFDAGSTAGVLLANVRRISLLWDRFPLHGDSLSTRLAPHIEAVLVKAQRTIIDV